MPNYSKQRRTVWTQLSMIFLLWAAFSLRLSRLDQRILRTDEVSSYLLSLPSPPDLVENQILPGEPHPVASYFFKSSWLYVAGDSLFALRYDSVWFGLLAIALLYQLSNALGMARSTSALAAFFLSVSPFALSISQDAQMYSMSQALTIASVWLAIAWLQRQRTQYAVSYVLCATLALYSHYYAAYVLLALYLFVLSRALFFPGLQNSVINLLAPLFFIVLLYAPWFEKTDDMLSKLQESASTVQFHELFSRSLSMLSLGRVTDGSQPMVWAFIVLLLIIASVSLQFSFGSQLGVNRQYRRTLWLLLLYLLVPLFVIWFGNRSRSFLNEYSSFPSLPPLLLIIASGYEFSHNYFYRIRAAVNTDVAIFKWQHKREASAVILSLLAFTVAAGYLFLVAGMIVGMLFSTYRYLDRSFLQERIVLQEWLTLPINQEWAHTEKGLTAQSNGVELPIQKR